MRRPVRWFGDMQGIDGRYTCRRQGGCRPVVPPSWSPSSEGETQSGTFWHGQTRDAIDGRGDTPPRAETSSPASLLQRETDRKRGSPVRWFGVPIEDCRCCARRGPERSRRFSLPLGLPPLRERRGLARSAGERVARYSPPAGTRPAGNARSDVQMRRPAVLPPHGRGRDARRCLPGRRPTPLSAGPSETGLFLRQMSHRPDHWREPATTTVDAFGIVWYVNRGFIIPDTRRSSYVPPSIFYRTCTSGRRPVDRRRAGSRTGAVFLRSQCRPCDQLGLPRDADARRSDAGR